MDNNDKDNNSKVQWVLARACIASILVLMFFVDTVIALRANQLQTENNTETEEISTEFEENTEVEVVSTESVSNKAELTVNKVLTDLDIDTDYSSIKIAGSGNTYMYKTRYDIYYLDTLDKLLYNSNYEILSIDTSSNYCITFIYVGETTNSEVETEETETRDSSYETQ
jgi:hypothetical protein